MKGKASFVMFDRGLFHGTFGFVVDGHYPNVHPKPMFTALDKFRTEFPWAERVLKIQGDSPDLEELVTVAKERGWVVLSESNGRARPSWFDRVDYRSLIVDNSGWIGFKFQEFVYRPDPHGQLVEPDIPRELNGILYIDGSNRELKTIFEFMASCKRTWRLYVPQADRLEMALDIP
jgi:hypothetical protein